MDARLWELALISPAPSQLAQFYVDLLGYAGSWQGEAWCGAAAGRRLRIAGGASKALGHAGYAVPAQSELVALEARLATAGIAFRRESVSGYVGAVLRLSDPDGNPLLFGVSEPAATGYEGVAARTARLQHIVFASTRVDRMRDFYCNVIGFAPSDYVLDDAEALTSVFLRSSEEHHSLAIFRAGENRLDHYCHEVDNWTSIRDWADHFAAKHIRLRWGPGRHGPGNNLFLFINDCDDNWLEFSAELELVADDRPVGRWVHEERTLNSWGDALMRS